MLGILLKTVMSTKLIFRKSTVFVQNQQSDKKYTKFNEPYPSHMNDCRSLDKKTFFGKE